MELLFIPLSLVKSTLSSQSKLLYTIILYLCRSDTGSYYCCPTNEWLSKQLDCCENSITKYLKELRDNHYIFVKDDKALIDGNTFITRRVISLTELSAQDMYTLEQAYKMFHVEAFDEEMKNWTDSDLTVVEGADDDVTTKVITYLNNKAGTNFRATTKSYRKHIDARLKEGYTYEDFVKVIDNKVADWLYTDMEQYLRPSTLFQGKFDTYLNQRITVTPQQIEQRKLKQIQANTINPYQYNVPVDEQLYNEAQDMSDLWFSNHTWFSNGSPV